MHDPGFEILCRPIDLSLQQSNGEGRERQRG